MSGRGNRSRASSGVRKSVEMTDKLTSWARCLNALRGSVKLCSICSS